LLPWGRVFVKIRRRHHASQTYEYVDIVESQRVDGKIVRRRLGTLGRLDQLQASDIDRLIEHLRKLASPEGRRGVLLGEMEIVAVRELGVRLVASRVWEELGLNRLLVDVPRTRSARVSDAIFQEAIFRMVVNRLCDPQSKLALVDWTDEHQTLHRGWQSQVQWEQSGDLDYHHYLLSMDRLHPHRASIEEALFARTTTLLSLPLRVCFYDLTSSYFEGDGKSELAEYGYSRDHREDRAQVVVGLAITQEGLPITHRVFPGSTVDVTTFAPMAAELKQRFGVQEPVIVADRGMFSADNVAQLIANRQRYILALRARQQKEGELALDVAELEGLPRPLDLEAPWQWREVKLLDGVRHVVVYSAFKARHDFEVRARRIRRALPELHQLQRRAAREKLSIQRITERTTRILTTHKCARYISYQVDPGSLEFHIDRAGYCDQRRHDGIFVLETNHPDLSTEEVVASYAQLMEVERAFRVLKSLVKLRPIYHHRERRVEAHIFICFLAYLLAKVIELRLRGADLSHSIAHALDILSRLKAVEHTWEADTVVIKAAKPDDEVKAILDALGIRLETILAVSRPAAA
jgi:transposase